MDPFPRMKNIQSTDLIFWAIVNLYTLIIFIYLSHYSFSTPIFHSRPEIWTET